MRELKFRAYSKNLGMSRPAEFAELIGEPRTDFYEFDVYMQYTGLKDRHGVEIYEGDVVDTLHKKYPKQYPEKFYPNGTPAREVKWIVGPHHNGWNIYAGKKSQYEVIGNIHENPELLEFAS